MKSSIARESGGKVVAPVGGHTFLLIILAASQGDEDEFLSNTDEKGETYQPGETVIRIISARDASEAETHSSGSRLVRRKGGEPLSAHDLDLLEKLRHRKDSDIEFSDIPEVKVNTFTNRSGTAHLFRPYKQQITLRIDSDVIAWAKQEGTGYQSRINAALRTAMLKDTLTTRQTG